MQLHNKNIERSILSSIFYNPKLLDEISYDIASGTFFYDPDNRKIYEAMLRLHESNEPIAEDFIAKQLSVDKKFNTSSIVEIMGISPLVDLQSYTKELKELHFRRQMSKLSTNMFKLAKDPEKNKASIEDDIQRELFDIISNETSKGFLTAPEVGKNTIDHLKALKERGNQLITGITTGFDELDMRTTGFNQGDLIIIAARPAMGKTALALNMALGNLKAGNGVAFFSLEMPHEQLMLRLLAQDTSIPLQKMRIGDLDDNEWSRVSTSIDTLSHKTLIVDDNTSNTIGSIKTKARRLKMQYPIDLIIIDYLQLIQSAGNKDRHLEVSDISRGLKTLARELRIPIIALSQLNRELEKRVNKRPMISDLRESGSIEQDADIIMFVYREDVYKHLDELKKAQKEKEQAQKSGMAANNGNDVENAQPAPQDNATTVPAELIIGKQRNGPIGTVHLDFIKHLTKFSAIAGQEVAYQTSNNVQPTEANMGNMDLDTSATDMLQ